MDPIRDKLCNISYQQHLTRLFSKVYGTLGVYRTRTTDFKCGTVPRRYGNAGKTEFAPLRLITPSWRDKRCLTCR